MSNYLIRRVHHLINLAVRRLEFFSPSVRKVERIDNPQSVSLAPLEDSGGHFRGFRLGLVDRRTQYSHLGTGLVAIEEPITMERSVKKASTEEELSPSRVHVKGTPCHLFIDWDGTLTTKSTLEAVATLHPGRDGLLSLTEAYLKDLKEHTASYTPTKEERKTLEDEMAWLDSLVEVERRSVKRIERAGLFRNLQWPTGYRKALGESVYGAIERGLAQLRPGANELLYTWLQEDSDSGEKRIDVLSVNWCRDWIRRMLDDYKVDSRVGIASNDLDPRGSGRLSRTKDVQDGNYITEYENEDQGTEKDGLWTAGHKLEVMSAMIKTRWKEESGHCISCYVGDSPTDLSCLMEANVGICIRDEPLAVEQRELKETLERLNIESNPIQGLELYGRLPEGKKRVWYTSDLHEIRVVISLIQHQ